MENRTLVRRTWRLCLAAKAFLQTGFGPITSLRLAETKVFPDVSAHHLPTTPSSRCLPYPPSTQVAAVTRRAGAWA